MFSQYSYYYIFFKRVFIDFVYHMIHMVAITHNIVIFVIFTVIFAHQTSINEHFEPNNNKNMAKIQPSTHTYIKL